VFICADKILRTAVDVREVASAPAGDENFLADAVSKFEHRDAASAFAGFRRAQESCGTGAENESVTFVRQSNQPRRCKLSLPSILRLN
jgi:hypothetical protein